MLLFRRYIVILKITTKPRPGGPGKKKMKITLITILGLNNAVAAGVISRGTADGTIELIISDFLTSLKGDAQ
jgi:hypothetical protein